MADPVSLAIIGIGMAVGSGIAAAGSTKMAIDEQVDENADQVGLYNADIADANTMYADAEKTSARQKGFILEDMTNIAADNKYQVGVTAQKGALTTGATAAKLGYSGVRGTSPLAALRQQERFAAEELSDTTNQANASLLNKGNEITKAGDALATKKLETSLLTGGYQRKIDLLNKNSAYLKKNSWKMQAGAFLSATPQIINSAANLYSKAGT